MTTPPPSYLSFATRNLRLMDEARKNQGSVLVDLALGLRAILTQGPGPGMRTFHALRYLRGSPAFDGTFYRLQNDIGGRDPVAHYVFEGAQAGLDPAPGFDSALYLEANHDVREAGLNPLYHYLRYGRHESRRIEPSRRVELIERLFSQDDDGGNALSQANQLAFAGRGEVEDTGRHDWPKRDWLKDEDRDYGLYDIRPNDVVIDEARAGDAFLDRHDLLGDQPDWASAVEAINAIGSKTAKTPDVSIIIPVYGQLAYTLNALDSVLRHRSRFSFDVIVADDASPDDSGDWLPQISGIRYVRYAKNAGFIETCNRTAETARGQFIVLLNNDTRVCEGWLDYLIDSFDIFPDAGMTGSKFFYPDGSLQEAGGIVWRDGAGWNYGRNDDPNRPRYSYARRVDYVSGASICVRRADWQAWGGFDETYKPAYYEDTDLAMRVRAAGKSVIMQPLSRVIHYEGKTSGRDTASGIKAYQRLNQQTFFKRWAQDLQTHRAHGEKPWLEADRALPRRVLIVDACNPTPGEDAGSVATVDLMRAYQALGYQVDFVPEDNFLYQPGPVSYLQALGVKCFYAPYEVSMSSILSTYGHLYDVVQLIRPGVADKVIDLVKQLAPRARIAFLNADLHHLRMERQAESEKRPELRVEAQAMKEIELKLINTCDVTLVHSTYEQNLLRVMLPAARVVVLPLTGRVGDKPVARDRTDIIFLGGYNHPPNVDAARLLLDSLWPELAKRLPQARLILAGSHPPEALRKRANARVLVPGTVEHLEPLFATSRVFIAPLRYGAGAKGKLLSAMGNGVPVVATGIAAEGMYLEDGKTVFIADSNDDLIAQTVRLYEMPARSWQTAAAAAQAYVARHHSLAGNVEILRGIVPS